MIFRMHSTSEYWLWRQEISRYLGIPREVANLPAVGTLPERSVNRAKSRHMIAPCFLLPVTVVERAWGNRGLFVA